MEEKQIVLLNDTVATLLAGKSASFGHEYDSYIGFILGTGTNTCYIENNRNILKLTTLDNTKSQIINVESGAFGKVPQSDIDIAFDNTTVNPGDYKLEKMFAGGYFGGLCLMTLQAAAREGIFSGPAASGLKLINELSSGEVNNYVTSRGTKCGALQDVLKDKSDIENCIKIVESLIERSGKLVAANMAAVILKTDKGKSSERPVLITIEGTTFNKLKGLKTHFEKYLQEYLSGDRQRYYEFTEVQQSSLVGAALAALIN
jgi:hexokinase